ncbi:hypothetical protein L195_g064345, partial [Trifolium pratense]
MMMESSSIPSKDAEAETTNLPNWLELARDITANILSRLGLSPVVEHFQGSAADNDDDAL